MPDHEELRRRVAAAKGQTAGPSPTSANAVLSLQSKAGNAAVQQLARAPKAKDKKPKAKVRGLGSKDVKPNPNFTAPECYQRGLDPYAKKNYKEAVSWFEEAYDRSERGSNEARRYAHSIYQCYKELGFKEAAEFWLRVHNNEEPSERAPDSSQTHA